MNWKERFKSNYKYMAYQWRPVLYIYPWFFIFWIYEGFQGDPSAFPAAFITLGLVVASFLAHMIFNKYGR